jgi:hypothetical protein
MNAGIIAAIVLAALALVMALIILAYSRGNG